jgi:hypothetical protein
MLLAIDPNKLLRFLRASVGWQDLLATGLAPELSCWPPPEKCA